MTVSATRPTLVRDSSRNLLGAVIANAANVLVILVLARWVGEQGVGEYTLAFAMRAIAMLVCGLGMRTAMTRFVAAFLARDDVGSVRGSVVLGVSVPLGFAVLVSAVWYAASETLAVQVFGDAALTVPLQLAALSLPFAVAMDVVLAATQGFSTMKAYSRIGQILEPMLRLVLTFGVVLAGGGVEGAVGALLAASVVGALASLIALRVMTARLPSAPISYPARRLTAFGATSWVASLATQGVLWADVLILGVLVTTDEVGAYQVAARVVMIGMFVITPLTAAMAPRIATSWERGQVADVTDRHVKVVLWCSRLTWPLLACVAAVPALVLGIFGSGFAGASTVVVILAVGAAFEALGAPSSVLLNQIGRNRLNMVLNVSALALNIGLNLLLIPVWGINGAAVAWASTLVIGALVRVVVVRRIATGHWPWTQELAGAAVAAALATVAAALVGRVPIVGGVRLALAALAVLIVYLVALWFGGLTRAERLVVTRRAALLLPGVRRWRDQRRLRAATPGEVTLEIESIISPFRIDVLARQDVFLLAREHPDLVRDDFDAFVALVRRSRYGGWFDEVLVARGHVVAATERAKDQIFAEIVTSCLQVMHRFDREGLRGSGRVTVGRVPAGAMVEGCRVREERLVLLDGGHRIALALLAGATTLAPEDYVLRDGLMPPNNTARLLASGIYSAAEVDEFVASGQAALPPALSSS